ESQFAQVNNEELPKIKRACERAGKVASTKNYRPSITVIIVGKRHHTRLYPTDEAGSDGKSGHPMPGTVVDRGVTSVYDYDFYLQAHQGLKGTARPAHYYVIHDENGFKSNKLYELTHNLCYLFGRATKGVSICPP